MSKGHTDVTHRYDTTDLVITRTETKPNKPTEHTPIFYLIGTGAIAEETDGHHRWASGLLRTESCWRDCACLTVKCCRRTPP